MLDPCRHHSGVTVFDTHVEDSPGVRCRPPDDRQQELVSNRTTMWAARPKPFKGAFGLPRFPTVLGA